MTTIMFYVLLGLGVLSSIVSIISLLYYVFHSTKKTRDDKRQKKIEQAEKEKADQLLVEAIKAEIKKQRGIKHV